MRKTIKENFGVDVNYYAVVDFKGFLKLPIRLPLRELRLPCHMKCRQELA